MNTFESAAKKIIIGLLKDVEANHKELINLVAFGKLTYDKKEEIYQDILWTIKTLHPLFDIADKFIPDDTKLQDVMDWCQEIYHQVIEPIQVTPQIKK